MFYLSPFPRGVPREGPDCCFLSKGGVLGRIRGGFYLYSDLLALVGVIGVVWAGPRPSVECENRGTSTHSAGPGGPLIGLACRAVVRSRVDISRVLSKVVSGSSPGVRIPIRGPFRGHGVLVRVVPQLARLSRHCGPCAECRE